jgi:hypothetical protein
MVPRSPIIYAEKVDPIPIVTQDSFVIYLCINYYNSNLKWPKDNNDFLRFYDKPKGNFNTTLIDNIILAINNKNNLEIKVTSNSIFRNFELRYVENENIKYKAKYFESNDPRLKGHLPFELNYTGLEYEKFYGNIK